MGRTILDSDKPQFPQPTAAPKSAPNVVLILLDDTGFGQYSTFGGDIPSPTIQKLAEEGLRYNRFHTTALGCNRGVYHDGWMASSMAFIPWNPIREAFDPDQAKWELYNIDADFSQASDLAKENPQKLRQLEDLWWSGSTPSCRVGRLTAATPRRSRTTPGQIGLPNEASPRVLNKSWTISADIDVGDKSEGMIVTQGGMPGGYGLYLRDGKPTFVYNYLDLERYTIAGKEALPKGKVKLVVHFTYDGKESERGKGGNITLAVNGTKVAEGQLPRTIPLQISLGEGMDIGTDAGSAVDFTYALPFTFTGTIEKVTFDLK